MPRTKRGNKIADGNPLTRGASILMLYLSERCKTGSEDPRPVGRQNARKRSTVEPGCLIRYDALRARDCRQSLPRTVIRAANDVVERIGIEPMTPCLQSRCSPS